MSAQTTVHLRWTVPCSLAHTADTHGTWNELQSDLPRCMRAQGLAYLRVTRLVKGLLRCPESSARSALAIHSPSVRGGGSSAGSEVLQVNR